MSTLAACLTAGIVTIAAPAALAKEAPPTVASILPVHSLVAAVMKDIGAPHLIIRAGASPHHHSLLPSDAEALAKARIVFWIGPELETSLASSISSLAAYANVVQLEQAPGLTKLPLRESGPSESGEHAQDSHDEHGRAGARADADHASHEGGTHLHGSYDPHLWLDPENAIAMVGKIEEALSAADPENSARYSANANALEADIGAMSLDIEAMLAPVRDRPFIVFHDGYQYFEKRFALNAAGSITVSPERAPGAKRIQEIRERIKALAGVCVLAEPQFEPRYLATVTEGTGARVGILDPLGSGVDDGPDLYPKLMRNLARSLADCLTSSH